MILKSLRRLGSFIVIMILIHTMGASFFATSDYLLCWLFNNSCARYFFFQRVAIYLALNFVLSFYTGFFLIIMALMVAQSRYQLSFGKLAAIGSGCGGIFALNTSHLIWSLYINSPEKEYRYIVVVLITMGLTPYIIHLFRKII